MRTFAAVTTCSAEGWAKYGERMHASFLRHWPSEVSLTVYSEDKLPIDSMPMPTWLDDFKKRQKDNPAAHGLRRSGGYNYAFDCVRFAHKVAAVLDAGFGSPADVVIWMDADTFTHADIDCGWLESLLPEDAYIGWLDRIDKFPYPECGFYMLAAKHQAHGVVMRRWRKLYETGEVLSLHQTNDCVSLEHIIKGAEAEGLIRVHSISGEQGRKCAHPFVNSALGSRMDHLKGPRKNYKRSHDSDLIGRTRPEAYWK